MALGQLGWRVPPHGRAAHMMSWDPTGNRSRYETACGAVMYVSHIVDNPGAKQCAKCKRALKRQEPQP